MDHTWLVRETEFRRPALRAQEAVYTIGNGYVSTRGTFEEGFIVTSPPPSFTGYSTTPPWW